MKLPSRYVASKQKWSGGLATASCYVDQNLERKVLIKEIVIDGQQSRLLDEIQSLQRIKSSHIVEIYDVIIDEDGDVRALVEEYIPGQDLMDLDRPLDSNFFYKIMYQISSALADMHSCQVIHRDIKPNNMKFDAEGVLKIFDLNLAKHERIPATTKGIVGTLGYMAPELFLSSPIIDFPVDIYALGCTAFRIVSGSVPRCASRQPPVAHRSSTKISDFVEVSSKTDDMINSCLSVDASDRPTASDLKIHFSRELLFGKHRIAFRYNGLCKYIDEINKSVSLSKFDNKLIVKYDGYDLVVKFVSGDVYINNELASVDDIIPKAAVITLGDESLRGRRVFVTIDINNPEVVL